MKSSTPRPSLNIWHSRNAFYILLIDRYAHNFIKVRGRDNRQTLGSLQNNTLDGERKYNFSFSERSFIVSEYIPRALSATTFLNVLKMFWFVRLFICLIPSTILQLTWKRYSNEMSTESLFQILIIYTIRLETRSINSVLITWIEKPFRSLWR